uniref:RING-type domain-containing protein n=2 Tax=Tetranychus urticae TaxID=32264 RepID=T1KIJ9_TETUR
MSALAGVPFIERRNIDRIEVDDGGRSQYNRESLRSAIRNVVDTTINYFANHVIARFPQYMTFESRLATFKDWPNPAITPKELAEAGFFYAGRTDLVTCFHCANSIFEWVKHDNAWVMHALFAPCCTFIYIKCGVRFIETATSRSESNIPVSANVEPANSRYTCKICLEKEVGCCFYPCDHAVTCIDCTPGIATCPLCRSFVAGVFRLKFID